MKGPRPPTADRGTVTRVADQTFARTMAGFRKFVDKITPWLLDLGSWIFGALLAFDLVILGALLTVGPVDGAVLVATAAFALALPTEVAGFAVLRLAADMKSVGLEEVATTAFQEVGFTFEQPPGSTPQEAIEKRRVRMVLLYSYALLALAAVLTFVGMAAALWHMAWWIGVVFMPAVVLSLAIILLSIASGGSPGVWRSPTEPRSNSSAPGKKS